MYAEQIIFECEGTVGGLGGILIDKKIIICGCCGEIIDANDEKIKIIKHLKWIPISDEIIGDQAGLVPPNSPGARQIAQIKGIM